MPQTKLQRVRSTLAVIMAILIPIFLMLSVLLLFPLLIFYVPWMIYDWHTPERGGRSSKWLRGRTLWEYMRDYFPYTLLKTTDLPADRHYIFGVHPHGGAPVGLFLNFCTEATGFSKLFPGITPHATSLIGNYRFPIGRDINLLFGSCSVSSKSIDYLLSSPLTREELANGAKAHRTIGSQAVVIAIGGQHEMLDAHPGSFRLTLRDRRGFARKALQHGADLVPVFQFGENDLYNQVANPVGRYTSTYTDTYTYTEGILCIYVYSTYTEGTYTV